MKFNSRTFAKAVIAALTLCLLPPTVYARSDKLVEPAPVTLNCQLSDGQMKSGIRNGGAVRNWVVVNETPGFTELNYKKGDKYSLTVDVSYTENTFAVTYRDSINLNYHVNKKGVREIHPNPINWMRNLSGDIERVTNSECFAGSDESNQAEAESKSDLIQQCIDACAKATNKTPEVCFDNCTD